MSADVDARRAYAVWLQLISDELLYEAVLDRRHRALAESRGLAPEDLDILDELAAQPGTRWNVENLRYRASMDTGACLISYMPLSLRLLTGGNADWLQDLCFEYLAYHRWKSLGHQRLTECERFAEFVQKRILKRRAAPAHFEHALAYELAVIALLKRTAGLAATWPAAFEDVGDDALAAMRPRPSPASALISLPVDLSTWLRSGDPKPGEVRAEPRTFLVFVPTLEHAHKLQTLSEGSRVLFEACDGAASCGEIARRMEEEHEVDPADVLARLRRWLTDRALVADGSAVR